jgi:hypothetical protein
MPASPAATAAPDLDVTGDIRERLTRSKLAERQLCTLFTTLASILPWYVHAESVQRRRMVLM